MTRRGIAGHREREPARAGFEPAILFEHANDIGRLPARRRRRAGGQFGGQAGVIGFVGLIVGKALRHRPGERGRGA